MLNPDINRNSEWPIVKFWYTKKKGQTIEHIIDTDISFFEWAVNTFQNITPSQAEYYTRKTGYAVNPRVVQDVEPYEWKKGDSDRLYIELCETQDLQKVLRKYRGEMGSLF